MARRRQGPRRWRRRPSQATAGARPTRSSSARAEAPRGRDRTLAGLEVAAREAHLVLVRAHRARAQREQHRGLALDHAQRHEHRGVARRVGVEEEGGVSPSEWFPLTPVQRWFFELQLEDKLFFMTIYELDKHSKAIPVEPKSWAWQVKQ